MAWESALLFAQMLFGRTSLFGNPLAFNAPDDLAVEDPLTEANIHKAPQERTCCGLGWSGDDGRSLNIEELRSGLRHRYQSSHISNRDGANGGLVGFICTRRGGIIDVGHVRDQADRTFWFFNRLSSGATAADITNKVSSSLSQIGLDGSLHYTIFKRTTDLSLVDRALISSYLAYQHAVWHEIETWFSTAHRYSSFSPEDCFSNALGVLVGFKAIVTKGTGFFDDSVQKHLVDLINYLGPISSNDDISTQDVINYFKDYWWQSGLFSTNETLRKNMNGFGIIKPWLVQNVAVPDKAGLASDIRNSFLEQTPAEITIPTHVGNIPISQLAQLEVHDADQRLAELLPGPVKMIDTMFETMTEKLKLLVTSEGFTIDPGPQHSW